MNRCCCCDEYINDGEGRTCEGCLAHVHDYCAPLDKWTWDTNGGAICESCLAKEAVKA